MNLPTGRQGLNDELSSKIEILCIEKKLQFHYSSIIPVPGKSKVTQFP